MGAIDLLQHLHTAGFHLAVAGDKLLVSPADKLTDADCARITIHKPALLALLVGANVPPTNTSLACDSVALVEWTDAEIARFLDRRGRLLRWGWAEPEAERLARRLIARDREGDDRRLCLECSNLRCKAGGWRCGAWHRAGIGEQAVAGDLVVMPQRCPGFTEGVND